MFVSFASVGFCFRFLSAFLHRVGWDTGSNGHGHPYRDEEGRTSGVLGIEACGSSMA